MAFRHNLALMFGVQPKFLQDVKIRVKCYRTISALNVSP